MPEPASAFDERMASVSRFARPVRPQVLELGVGIEARSKARRDADDYPLGGVILEVHPGGCAVDHATGEVTEHPAEYLTYDARAPLSSRWHLLSEDELDLTTLSAGTNLGLLVRVFAGDLAVPKQARGARRHGAYILSGHELDLCRYIGALARVIGGGIPTPVPNAPRRSDDDNF